jgi:Domain of unknown function (DUF4252)
MKYLNSILFATLFFLASAYAQSGDVTKEPGYVDFGNFTQFENSTGVTEVTLDEELLSTIAEISPDDDPNIMEILKGLKLVKANVYNVSEENKKDLEAKINSIDSKLSGSSWKRIVRTKKENEVANVYIKQNSSKQIIGLVVTSLDGSDEAAFVNIVGTIDLKTIGKLAKKFDIPQLEGIKDNEK